MVIIYMFFGDERKIFLLNVFQFRFINAWTLFKTDCLYTQAILISKYSAFYFRENDCLMPVSNRKYSDV